MVRIIRAGDEFVQLKNNMRTSLKQHVPPSLSKLSDRDMTNLIARYMRQNRSDIDFVNKAISEAKRKMRRRRGFF